MNTHLSKVGSSGLKTSLEQAKSPSKPNASMLSLSSRNKANMSQSSVKKESPVILITINYCSSAGYEKEALEVEERIRSKIQLESFKI
jgi:hypothetical protein